MSGMSIEVRFDDLFPFLRVFSLWVSCDGWNGGVIAFVVMVGIVADFVEDVEIVD